MASHQDSPLNSPTSTSPIKLVLDSPTWFGGTPTSYGNSSQDRDGPLTPAVAIKLLPGDFGVAGGMLNCAGKPRLPLGWTCGLRPQRQSCLARTWTQAAGGWTQEEERSARKHLSRGPSAPPSPASCSQVLSCPCICAAVLILAQVPQVGLSWSQKALSTWSELQIGDHIVLHLQLLRVK